MVEQTMKVMINIVGNVAAHVEHQKKYTLLNNPCFITAAIAVYKNKTRTKEIDLIENITIDKKRLIWAKVNDLKYQSTEDKIRAAKSIYLIYLINED